jgi:hypothetical protein
VVSLAWLTSPAWLVVSSAWLAWLAVSSAWLVWLVVSST